jgi:hypothetical protein
MKKLGMGLVALCFVAGSFAVAEENTAMSEEFKTEIIKEMAREEKKKFRINWGKNPLLDGPRKAKKGSPYSLFKSEQEKNRSQEKNAQLSVDGFGIVRAIDFFDKDLARTQALVSIQAVFATPIMCEEDCKTILFVKARGQTGPHYFGNWITLTDLDAGEFAIRNFVTGVTHTNGTGQKFTLDIGAFQPKAGVGSATNPNAIGWQDGFRLNVTNVPRLGTVQVTMGQMNHYDEPNFWDRFEKFHFNFLELRVTREVWNGIVGSIALIEHDDNMITDISAKRKIQLAAKRAITLWAGFLAAEGGALKYEIGMAADPANLLFGKTSKFVLKTVYLHMDKDFPKYGTKGPNAYSWFLGDSLQVFLDYEFRPGVFFGVHGVQHLNNPVPDTPKNTFGEVWVLVKPRAIIEARDERRFNQQINEDAKAVSDMQVMYCYGNFGSPECDDLGLTDRDALEERVRELAQFCTKRWNQKNESICEFFN